jgi:hypothetical protein
MAIIILDIIVLTFFKHSGSGTGYLSVIGCKGRMARTRLSPLEGEPQFQGWTLKPDDERVSEPLKD